MQFIHPDDRRRAKGRDDADDTNRQHKAGGTREEREHGALGQELQHDAPMSGKTWYGQVEVDQSSGAQQIQLGIPVLDGGKPIGSIVIGLKVTKLL